MQQGIYHLPVLLHEAIDGLQITPSGVYVDCTFGGGGHSREILKHLNSEGKLIAFDQDADAVKNVPDDERIIFVPHNFRHLQRFLKFHKISKVNGVLADLGVSSHQLNVAVRGFSTRMDAALDMRMNQSEKMNAVFVLKNYNEEKLHKMFEQYGEVTNAKTLAKMIVELRISQPFHTTAELKNALYPVVKGNPEKYFAQVFQALRIEVNDELNALKDLLAQLPAVLADKGRIAIITFHSLEDRIVKNFFKYENSDDSQKDIDIYGTVKKKSLKIITKKPIIPSSQELKINPRSRSSKLRIAEKENFNKNLE